MPDEAPLTARLARTIARSGPISVSDYMAQANAHYYATRDPFGTDGDFITAPEISQMFGELVGAWLADLWSRAGRHEGCHYVELGPGRGTLAADALRAARVAGLEPPVHLVETSPLLRAKQGERLPQAHWHDGIETLPEAGPLLIVANEFFDALPVQQCVATDAGWVERAVGHDDGCFLPVAGAPTNADWLPQGCEPGTIAERSPASLAIAGQLGARIARQGGAMLIVDYGHARSATGDTLQAVRAHAYADPWSNPGESDLTAHVDFEALRTAIEARGSRCRGPAGQGDWLRAIGVDLRAAALARSAPDRASAISEARDRLVEPDRMGRLFKVLAAVAPGWPEPAGFA